MDTDTYEVIVIGAGIAGSATAYNIAAALQNSGGEVLLVEQVRLTKCGAIWTLEVFGTELPCRIYREVGRAHYCGKSGDGHMSLKIFM